MIKLLLKNALHETENKIFTFFVNYIVLGAGTLSISNAKKCLAIKCMS